MAISTTNSQPTQKDNITNVFVSIGSCSLVSQTKKSRHNKIQRVTKLPVICIASAESRMRHTIVPISPIG